MMKHPPGCHRISGRTYFTLYAPYAQTVRLLLFETCDAEKETASLPMRSIGGGFWEYSDIRPFAGQYYAFRIDELENVITDPYARSVSTFNDFHQPSKGYIFEDDFNWEGDTFISPADPRDLIIYEAHVRDMTAHPSSAAKDPGTYAGLVEKIDYLKDLGVNAIELLPIQHFANHEPPYAEAAHYVQNTWNPYAYNHWGYMTAFFFAPANFYSLAGCREKGTWSDPRGQEITELKSMVKAYHKAGIAVIMDVVYNHISQYNLNPLRQLAEQHYIDPNANTSGCGNDVRSESPVMKQLIIDSIRYWMEEFHIDGFRFDLAGLLDDDTLSQIRKTAMSIHPNAVLVGEPWGKRYFPQRMSDLGFGVWNDVYRNGVKGENPYDRHGYIFGTWDQTINKDNIGKLLTGSLRKDGGLVPDSRFTVNYLASHDGYTLADFIRIASRKTVIASKDRQAHIKLSDDEAGFCKLAAFIQASSQGILMLHAGQEFARSKVIVQEPGVDDPSLGEMDHDSYNKDNDTNYMDYDGLKINEDLYAFYQGLLSVRKAFVEIRAADRKQLSLIRALDNDFGQGYIARSANRTCAVLINASRDETATFVLENGLWNVHADPEFASVQPRGVINGGQVNVSPGAFYLLVKINGK